MSPIRFWTLPLLGALLAVGCGTSGSGPYHLSGKVTFQGQAVPRGRIFLLPDTAKGNSGQGGFAEIKDGLYDTRRQGRATPGGALIVRIDGFDGKSSGTNVVGEPLFLTYEVMVDVPRQDTTRDFEVPASAAKNLTKQTDPP